MVEFQFHHSDKWNQRWVTCPVCKKLLKEDGKNRHYTWMHVKKSHPRKEHAKAVNTPVLDAPVS